MKENRDAIIRDPVNKWLLFGRLITIFGLIIYLTAKYHLRQEQKKWQAFQEYQLMMFDPATQERAQKEKWEKDYVEYKRTGHFPNQ